jgi:hypothetical protein
MVGRSEQLVTRSQQSNDDFSQCAHVRETQSEVMETGRSCPCWLRLAIPSVQCNMMVIVASGEKRGVVIALCDPQADYVSIKDHRPVKVADGQVDVSDVGARADLRGHRPNRVGVGHSRKPAGRVTAKRVVRSSSLHAHLSTDWCRHSSPWDVASTLSLPPGRPRSRGNASTEINRRANVAHWGVR